MSLTKIENTNTETAVKKTRKAREVKTTFENAAKACGFKDQREVAHAILYIVTQHAQKHMNDSADFATRRKFNVALKVAKEYVTLQNRGAEHIGENIENENAELLADLAPLF